MVEETKTNDRVDQSGSAALNDVDLAILARVERALADGMALKRWWEQKEAAQSYAEQFELVREFNPSDISHGFFDQAELNDRVLPVMGSVEDSLYDQPKQAASEKVLNEFREFFLHYFMRVSSYIQPVAHVKARRHATSPYLRGLSWCPEGEGERTGFGFSQHYYKLRGSGLIGKFRREEESAIVDLREIGERYEWIVVKVRIFNFNLTFRLPQPDGAQLVVPLEEETFLVMNRDFITNEDNPRPGVSGRYGFGYAFIRNLTEGLFAYGPGQFEAAIELINFYVLESGQTRAHLVFVVNRPDRVLNVSINPFDWSLRLADLVSLGMTATLLKPIRNAMQRLPLSLGSFDPMSAYITLANQLTAGVAADELCISREQMEKDFLVQHFMQHYAMLVGSLLTWRQIPNWLDKSEVPDWVIAGIKP